MEEHFTMKEKDQLRIESFWTWFVSNEQKIKDVIQQGSGNEKELLVNALDNQILAFGLFKWEIGPGDNRPFFFTISPNGSEELLQISTAIIDAAPYLSDWDFYPALPVKAHQLQFTLFDDFLTEHEIDATTWKAVLNPHFSRKVEIMIEAGNISHLAPETLLEAGDIATTHLLGESLKITHVKKIEVLPKLPETYKEEAFLITELKSRLEGA